MALPTDKPAFAGIICPIHGKVDIDLDEYIKQLDLANSLWKCPICKNDSVFDQNRYEAINIPPED